MKICMGPIDATTGAAEGSIFEDIVPMSEN